MSRPLRIGFISTRFHGTDGVTLEAKKWARVLTGNGHSCFWFAGKLDTPEAASFLCEKAFFDHSEVSALQSGIFGKAERAPEMTRRVHALREEMKDGLYAFLDRFKLDLLIPQNILAIPMHVPLGMAMTEVLAETGIPAIAHHHDFAWERERFARCAVPEFVRMAFPPVLGRKLRNVVINTQAQEELARRTGQQATVIPNVFDFEIPPPAPDSYAAEFRAEMGISQDETLVLQPTRVVPRKGIEYAVELVHGLQKRGRKVVLLVSHDAGDEGFAYQELLRARADEAGIRCLFAADCIAEERCEKADGSKVFTLWDVYTQADFVTYPSLYEGFGNALLETFYFRKPVLVNRYPVFTRDIAPLGFRVVEMDAVVTREVIEKVETVLAASAEVSEEMAEHNYQLARRHFSHQILQSRLVSLVEEVGSETAEQVG